MGRRSVSPDDRRLKLLADMRSRGLTQAEMSKATGLSQQTCSRLMAFYDSLATEERARAQRERDPGTLLAMMRREAERRSIRERIETAYHAGDLAAAAKLNKQLADI